MQKYFKGLLLMIIFYYGNLIISSRTPNNILNPLLFYIGARAVVKFNGSCLELEIFREQ